MTLNERDRRVLAGIEEALAASDPELTAAFDRAARGRSRPARDVLTWFVVVSLVLLSTGLVLHDTAMLIGGLLVLASAPACVWLVHFASGAHR